MPIDHSLPQENTLNVDGSSAPKIIGQSGTRLVAPSPVSPLSAGRVNGRFMDVVSSPLKGRATPLQDKPVSRQGVTIPSPSLPSPSSDRTESDVNPDNQVASNQTTWPDPIEVQNNNNTTEPLPVGDLTSVPVSEADDADIDKISNDIAETLGQTASVSPESPFLAGAKVDKRPLGAFSSEVSNDQTADVDTQNKVDVSTDSQYSAPKADVNVVTPLPAELSSDLLSIESDTAVASDVEKPLPVQQANPEPIAPVVEAQQTTVSVPSDETKVGEPQAVQANAVVSDYNQHPNPVEDGKSEGAVYDASLYGSSALLHPVKKKSGWSMILWIIVLLVIGASSGAAIFFGFT